MPVPRLHLFCGKIAAGKSTLAEKIAKEHGALLLSEDIWTAALWPGELTSVEAYSDRTGRLKAVLWPHLAEILQAGQSVALDFPANTRRQRARLKRLIDASGADHVLHVLDVPDAVCLARLEARNADGGHPYSPSIADFRQFAKYFEPPSADEGFAVRAWPHVAPPDDA